MKRTQHLSIALSLYLSVGCAHLQSPHRSSWDQPRNPQVYKKVQAVKTWNEFPTSSTPPRKHIPPPEIKELLEQPQPWQPFNTYEGSSIVSLAEQFLGVPYRWGGESPEEGFDCSGFVQHVYMLKGIQLPRLANYQFLEGIPIPKDDLSPGDLVFFSSSGEIVDHVGIYVNANRFIHAPRTGRVVSYDNLDSAYFSARYQGAKRVL